MAGQVCRSGNKTGGSRLFRRKGLERHVGRERRPQKETGMWPTGKIVSAWWRYARRVVVISAVVYILGCSGPGRSSSTPAALSPDREQAGPMIQGDGDGGDGM
jgi:hypothetical protein